MATYRVSDSVMQNVRDLLSAYEETQLVTLILTNKVSVLEALLEVLVSREARV